MTNKKTGYYLGNGHISFWAMPPISQPLVAKPVASKSFTALYCKENGSHLPVGEDKDSPGKGHNLLNYTLLVFPVKNDRAVKKNGSVMLFEEGSALPLFVCLAFIL